MTELEKQIRDMRTIAESIRLNWLELTKSELSDEARAGIRKNTHWLIDELKQLMEKIAPSAPGKEYVGRVGKIE